MNGGGNKIYRGTKTEHNALITINTGTGVTSNGINIVFIPGRRKGCRAARAVYIFYSGRVRRIFRRSEYAPPPRSADRFTATCTRVAAGGKTTQKPYIRLVLSAFGEPTSRSVAETPVPCTRSRIYLFIFLRTNATCRIYNYYTRAFDV